MCERVNTTHVYSSNFFKVFKNTETVSGTFWAGIQGKQAWILSLFQESGAPAARRPPFTFLKLWQTYNGPLCRLFSVFQSCDCNRRLAGNPPLLPQTSDNHLLFIDASWNSEKMKTLSKSGKEWNKEFHIELFRPVEGWQRHFPRTFPYYSLNFMLTTFTRSVLSLGITQECVHMDEYQV